MTLTTPHGPLRLPAFTPDATRGVVRGLDSADLLACGVEGLMVSVFHLARLPGPTALRALGGIHAMLNWDGPVATDSGGFQVFSLARSAPSRCRISSRGFAYREAGKRRFDLLSPEKSIRLQYRAGSDILMCLDHCTHPKDSRDLQRRSVDNTVSWAAACRREFDRLLAQSPPGGPPPLLFAVVQGGASPELRRECAEGLLEIGFDGYGFGGWPVDGSGGLVEAVRYVAGLLPEGTPLFGLGIGRPDNLVEAWRAGYRLFDCSLPTRDARRGRLFVFAEPLGEGRRPSLAGRAFFRTLNLAGDRFRRATGPIEDGCDCPACRSYSRGYVHHLFAVGDSLAWRLASAHNLRFYARLIDLLRSAGSAEEEKK